MGVHLSDVAVKKIIFSEQSYLIIRHKLAEEVSIGRKHCWGASPRPSIPGL